MRLLVVLLLVSQAALAQSAARPKQVPLSKLYTDAQTKISELEIDKHSLEARIQERDDQIAELTRKNQDLDTQLQKFIQLQKDTMAFNQQVIDGYKQLGAEHALVVDKFNQLLTYARNLASDNAQMARNQQYSQQAMRTLALYSLLPKYQPQPYPLLQPQINSHTNCVSRTIGTTVYTDCN